MRRPKDQKSEIAEIDELAGMTQRGFGDFQLKPDVKEDVQKLKSEMHEVRQAVGLRR